MVQDTTDIAKSDSNKEYIFNLILNRKKFYKKSLRMLITTLLLGIISLVFLICTITFVRIDPPQAKYIPATLDGIVIKSSNLLEPKINGKIISDDFVKTWAQNAIPMIYNYDFLSGTVNFRKMIKYFTPYAYKQYIKALETESKTLASIKAMKQVAVGRGCGLDTVNIIEKGINNIQGYPVYTWRLEMPIVSEVANADMAYFMTGRLILIIQRVPELLANDGIEISTFVFADAKAYAANNTVEDLCKNINI